MSLCSIRVLLLRVHLGLPESADRSEIKGVTAKMSLSLSISGHTLVMESLKPRVNAFKEENDSNNLTLGSRDSLTQVWPETQSHFCCYW